MDTRNKILTPEEALKLAGPVAVAAGTFNPLRAAEARELAAFHERTPGASLLALVLPADPELLPQAARAELAAALRVVSYVVPASSEDWIDALRPAARLRLEDHTAALLVHVRDLADAAGQRA